MDCDSSWGAAEVADEIFAGDNISIAYTLSENHYNGSTSVQPGPVRSEAALTPRRYAGNSKPTYVRIYLRMHTRFVSAGKILALVIFVTVAVALGVYLVKKRKPMEMGEVKPLLDGRIVAIFHNTRYAHEQDGKVKFVLTAGVDKAYENGGH